MSAPVGPRPRLLQLLLGGWVAQCVAVAAELGLIDALAEQPDTAAGLAERLSLHGESLARLLRVLLALGVVARDGERYAPSEMGALLRADRPDSVAPMARLTGGVFLQTWGALAHTVRTGEVGFEHVFGETLFPWLHDRPEGEVFDACMAGLHGPESWAVLDALDLSGASVVADVGGGKGSLLSATLRRHPHLTGFVLDLPDVGPRALANFAADGIAGRARFEEGSFFESVPSGADVYLLRHVLHDWDDPEALRILASVRDAMSPGAALYIIESVIPPGDDWASARIMDLHMMVLVGGRERTEAEYASLVGRAGLRFSRLIPTARPRVSVVEAHLPS